MGHAFFSTRLGPLDVLAFIEEGKTYEDLFKHTVKIEFRGHCIRVLDIKMLIALKRTSRDAKDRRRLPVLEETLRQLEKDVGIDSDIRNINDQGNKKAEQND